MAFQFGREHTAEQVADTLSNEIKGKNVIVTGASPKGLGAEVARVIAKYANLVVIAGRGQARLEETAEDIRKEKPTANIRLLIFDLSSFALVRKAAAEVNAYSEPIHVLINNAAVLGCPYGVTEDGFETQFGSNHLAHFLFTSLIYPKLIADSSSSSPARVVSVSSGAHVLSDIRFEDPGFSDGKAYENMQAYGQSKTANILFANEISRRAKEAEVNLIAFSLHPGTINTPIARHLTPEYLKEVGFLNEDGSLNNSRLKTIETGSATHIVAAFDPSIKDQTGAFLFDARIAEERRAPHAASVESGKKLWSLSEDAVKHKFNISQ